MDLKILVLGEPKITWQDVPVTITRRIPRAILYYLAICGEAVGRNELITVIWPEISERIGKSYLRDNLSKLRAALPAEDLILADTETVSLDFDRVYVDLKEYHHIQASVIPRIWDAKSDQPLPDDLHADCSRAALLWRSQRLMAGFRPMENAGYSDWLLDVDRRYARSRVMLLERLAMHSNITRDKNSRLTWYSALAETDPYNEFYQLGVLQSLVDQGRLDEAVLRGKKISRKYAVEGGVPLSNRFLAYLRAIEGNGSKDESTGVPLKQ